jgi:hypothetical protein
MHIHNHNTQRKLYLQLIFKKSMINFGINIYNKVLDQIKLREDFNSFKKDLKLFLLEHFFYSVDEFMSF